MRPPRRRANRRTANTHKRIAAQIAPAQAIPSAKGPASEQAEMLSMAMVLEMHNLRMRGLHLEAPPPILTTRREENGEAPQHDASTAPRPEPTAMFQSCTGMDKDIGKDHNGSVCQAGTRHRPPPPLVAPLRRAPESASAKLRERLPPEKDDRTRRAALVVIMTTSSQPARGFAFFRSTPHAESESPTGAPAQTIIHVPRPHPPFSLPP